jgi:hypothetical protein
MEGYVEQEVCEFLDRKSEHNLLLWGACTERELGEGGINHVMLRREK